MGAISLPEPVKAVCGVLFHSGVELASVEEALAPAFGAVDLRSDVWDFDFTTHYESETGPNIQRALLAFDELMDPGHLAAAKVHTNQLELDLAAVLDCDAPRPVNLDPGYVDLARLVLASARDRDHRVYLGRGIYGEATLRYCRGRLEPWEWTYPDYRTGPYLAFFEQVRARYVEQRRGRNACGQRS